MTARELDRAARDMIRFLEWTGRPCADDQIKAFCHIEGKDINAAAERAKSILLAEGGGSLVSVSDRIERRVKKGRRRGREMRLWLLCKEESR